MSGSLMLAVATACAGETRYGARLDQSLWRLQASRTQCRLSHTIPEYGQARFIRRPGERFSFSIDLPADATLAESAVIRAVPPPWKHDALEQDLSLYPVPLSAGTLELNEADAHALYAALETGMFVSKSPIGLVRIWWSSCPPSASWRSPMTSGPARQRYPSLLSPRPKPAPSNRRQATPVRRGRAGRWAAPKRNRQALFRLTWPSPMPP
ncbi:MAG: hypothetical protein HZB57_01135 [Gammaproteobacteria bacterium]|nr:hypothetical protein [Gammaproteobacteria bacterium]